MRDILPRSISVLSSTYLQLIRRLCTLCMHKVASTAGRRDNNEGKSIKMTSTKSKSRGFKSKPNTYYVDAAPTSRAHCRVCKELVVKGERRIVTNLFVRPGRWAKGGATRALRPHFGGNVRTECGRGGCRGRGGLARPSVYRYVMWRCERPIST